MKTTKYFDFRRELPDRKAIHDSWIEHVLLYPIRTEIQPDGRIRKWGPVEQAEGKILRVIVLEDGVTVHNAFFDRDFKGS